MADTTTAAFSIRIRVRLDNTPGSLGRLAAAIGSVGGNIWSLEGFTARKSELDEDLVVHCSSEAHQQQVLDAVRGVEGVELLEWEDRTFAIHQGGKIDVISRIAVNDSYDLSMAYTPGVARVCKAIEADPLRAHDLTIRKNTVAIVSDGTAVLGLGDIGPLGAMPVMEGKALLFKEFAGIDGFPICLDTKDPDAIVETVKNIAPSFGGINLEDIAAPVCFEVEDRLKELIDIPVFHDDQHGTAVVTLAALMNSLKIVDKRMEDLTVVIAGVGAAGVAISKILMNAGVRNIIGVDREGAVYDGRGNLNVAKQWFAENTNTDRRKGSLGQLMPGSDVFIGVSGPNLIGRDAVKSLAPHPIVFAMANPDPEIRPEEAAGVVAVMATGRSDFPNQINNVLCFPGIFRGALDVGATQITENMKVASALAIASTVSDAELAPDHVIPSVFDRRVAPLVAEASAKAAIADGVIRARS